MKITLINPLIYYVHTYLRSFHVAPSLRYTCLLDPAQRRLSVLSVPTVPTPVLAYVCWHRAREREEGGSRERGERVSITPHST